MKMKKIDIAEIEGFMLGNAENAKAGTGVTVVISEEGATAGVDVRGGGPATRETDLLRPENTVEKVHAVVLSGGSAFGLEAASGVMRSLAAKQIGFRVDEDIFVPIVPGASLYDLPVGRSDVFPDVEMGRQAVDNAYSGVFQTGNHGAGTGASVGKYMGYSRAMKTGLGTFACGDDHIQVGAVTAVNAVGDVYNGAGNIIAGLRTLDGTSIKGTIRVLKGMVHDESSPDLDLKDIKTIAAAEALKKDPEVSRPYTPEPKSDETSQEAPATEMDDIVKAMMKSYEEENPEAAYLDIEDSEAHSDTVSRAAAHDEPMQAEEAAPESEAEPEAAETEESAPSYSNLIDRRVDPAEYAEPASAAAEAVTASEEVSEEASAASDDPAGQQTSAYVEEPAQPVDDGYVLTEEDKADMGYDIPFNTTISCVITNAALTKAQCCKLAQILQDAYARAIKPVHGTLDGDTIFVMASGKQKVNFDAFAALATDVLQYAVIDGAMSAEGAYGLPAARDMIIK